MNGHTVHNQVVAVDKTVVITRCSHYTHGRTHDQTHCSQPRDYLHTDAVHTAPTVENMVGHTVGHTVQIHLLLKLAFFVCEGSHGLDSSYRLLGNGVGFSKRILHLLA
jgi:hypothetical protein